MIITDQAVLRYRYWRSDPIAMEVSFCYSIPYGFKEQSAKIYPFLEISEMLAAICQIGMRYLKTALSKKSDFIIVLESAIRFIHSKNGCFDTKIDSVFIFNHLDAEIILEAKRQWIGLTIEECVTIIIESGMSHVMDKINNQIFYDFWWLDKQMRETFSELYGPRSKELQHWNESRYENS